MVEDVSKGGTVTWGSLGDLFLKVSADCRTGVTVAYQPAAAVDVVKDATAADGKVAAVVIKPRSADFTLTLTRADGRAAIVQVRLPPDAVRTSVPN
ncbi:hypothetical protein OG455_09075 [Kitasatospora sp. NBC_01287]|uniref:hypothetical protein n=1 Tax=Kitasatospora sp. NBC_01287 TaxID=2903573 RepID=UPI00225618D8|nr:hypothetical protein [Kitasatospora sp. NBC_01287]MCX4745672.1 hypothetical protein [Kitasatospora sp. NBC_01287]